MEKEHDKLFFRTRGSQFDSGVLVGIRYGIRLIEWRHELTEEQVELAKRIDEASKDKEGQLLSLSADEAQVAAEAIERNIEFEMQNEGTLIRSDTIAADTALPFIREVAQAAQS